MPTKPAKTVTTINWNDGSTSNVNYKTVLNAGTATASGKVTGGTFAKGKLSSTSTLTPGAGQDCVTVPITSLTISGTFTIS
jgi:hypothetical protein